MAQPDWVETDPWGKTYADPRFTSVELPSQRGWDDALDGLTDMLPNMAPIAVSYGVFRYDSAQRALRPFVKEALFRTLRAWGDLPQDEQTDDDKGMPWEGWPDGKSHRTRRIYAWNFDKNGNVSQAMQVQKWDARPKADPSDPWIHIMGADDPEPRGWTIFNQWGEDLTFYRRTPGANWEAGFDLGDWVSQHQCDLGAAAFGAFQVLNTVITTAISFGAYGAVAASMMAVSLAVQKIGVGLAQAISKGDWSAAFSALVQMGAALAGVPFDSRFGSTLGDGVAGALGELGKEFLDSPVVRGVMSLIPEGGGELSKMIDAAIKYGQQIKGKIDLTEKAFNDYKNKLDPTSRFYMSAGWSATSTNSDVAAARASVPWYAQDAFDFGATAGAISRVQSGQILARKATRFARIPSAQPKGWSTGSKLLLGGVIAAGLAALAVRYTSVGQRTWRRVTSQPKKMLALEAAGVTGAGVLIYAMTREKKPSMLIEAASVTAMAPVMPSATAKAPVPAAMTAATFARKK